MMAPASSHSVNEAYRVVPSLVKLWELENPADATSGGLEASIIKHMDEADALYPRCWPTQLPRRQVASISYSIEKCPPQLKSAAFGLWRVQERFVHKV